MGVWQLLILKHTTCRKKILKVKKKKKKILKVNGEGATKEILTRQSIHELSLGYSHVLQNAKDEASNLKCLFRY